MKLIWFILFVPFWLIAENNGIVSGTILDSKTHNPLPGVNVIIKGT